jgi:glyoxylase-like metal-dependent hydrolase (beta-lactamase superfamily II)
MLRIGDFEVWRVEEISFDLWSTLLPDWRRERAASECPISLAPDFYDQEKDRFKVSIHSWLVKNDDVRILIDTCAGNDKSRPEHKLVNELDTPWLSRLAVTGVRPEDVDFVICTHLHVDHVGWNTRLVDGVWVPSFPNAKYVFSRLDFEAVDPAFGIAANGSTEHMIFSDSVLPILESGQAVIVNGGESVTDGVDLIAAPGHSPGHLAVSVRSKGQEAMFVGDVVHHPLQIYHPDWNSALCEDAVLARQTRRRLLDHCARHNSLFAPAHFSHPHCGEVRQEMSGFSFIPSKQLP